MPSIKIGYSGNGDNQFVNYTILAVSSEAADYDCDNIKLYWSLTRAFRSATVASIVTIDLDLGSAMAPVICLDHVNFASVRFYANSSNSWGSPAYDSAAKTISQDKSVGRYKIWFDGTGNSYRYWRISIPVQTPTDGAAYFSIGRVIVLNPTHIETPDDNIALGYKQTGLAAMAVNQFEDSDDSGAREIIYLDDHLSWRGQIAWDFIEPANLDDIWTINLALQRGLVVIYENNSDTSKFWLVHRDAGDSIAPVRSSYRHYKAGDITLIEVV